MEPREEERPRLPLLAIIGLLVLLLGQAVFAQANDGVQTDTLNRLDELGRKHGWWKIVAPKADKPAYSDGQLIEEGEYANGKRTGQWRRFWPNGNVMSEVTYVMGLPRGDYRTFYPNGKVEEQGDWDLDRNTGVFKRWHPNGKLAQDFTFNEYGVRDGVQRYYHENGKMAVEVHIKEGREEGTLKRWYPNGDPQQVAQFHAGEIDEAKSKYFDPVHPLDGPKPEASAPPAPQRAPDEITNAVVFRDNGYNTLYDKQLRIKQQGEFKEGHLWNGTYFTYSPAGLLIRKQVFADGRYVGNSPITEDDPAH